MDKKKTFNILTEIISVHLFAALVDVLPQGIIPDQEKAAHDAYRSDARFRRKVDMLASEIIIRLIKGAD